MKKHLIFNLSSDSRMWIAAVHGGYMEIWVSSPIWALICCITLKKAFCATEFAQWWKGDHYTSLVIECHKVLTLQKCHTVSSLYFFPSFKLFTELLQSCLLQWTRNTDFCVSIILTWNLLSLTASHEQQNTFSTHLPFTAPLILFVLLKC